MSFLKRLFGARPSAGGPTPEEVVAHAIDSVKAIAPTAEVERKSDTALMLRIGGQGGLWNLADIIRMAPEDPNWREGVAAVARKVVTRFGGKKPEFDLPMTTENIFVLVWTQATLDALGFKGISEPLVPGLVLFYGVRGGGKIRSIKADELEASGLDLAGLRKQALKNLDVSQERLGLGPLRQGSPILTNHTHHITATSLLADTPTWLELSEELGPLVVAIPAPSRLFVGPETPENTKALRELVQRSLEVEEEILTAQLLRFEDGRWSLVDTVS